MRTCLWFDGGSEIGPVSCHAFGLAPSPPVRHGESATPLPCRLATECWRPRAQTARRESEPACRNARDMMADAVCLCGLCRSRRAPAVGAFGLPLLSSSNCCTYMNAMDAPATMPVVKELCGPDVVERYLESISGAGPNSAKA
nr:unnamed protein product [Digitaria exilis]